MTATIYSIWIHVSVQFFILFTLTWIELQRYKFFKLNPVVNGIILTSQQVHMWDMTYVTLDSFSLNHLH